MERKKCECYAIRLFDQMFEAYEYFLKSPERGKKVLGEAARPIIFHLNDEFKEGEFTEKQEPYNTLLEEMSSALSRYDSGEGSGLDAMEWVRDTIHKSDELKQLMVCGTPYTDKEGLSETAKVLTEVLNTMSGMSSHPMEEAKVILNKQYEKLSCRSK